MEWDIYDRWKKYCIHQCSHNKSRPGIQRTICDKYPNLPKEERTNTCAKSFQEGITLIQTFEKYIGINLSNFEPENYSRFVGNKIEQDSIQCPIRCAGTPIFPRRQKPKLPEPISGNTTCAILESHHTILKDDPERLPTDFIKQLINKKEDPCPEVSD